MHIPMRARRVFMLLCVAGAIAGGCGEDLPTGQAGHAVLLVRLRFPADDGGTNGGLPGAGGMPPKGAAAFGAGGAPAASAAAFGASEAPAALPSPVSAAAMFYDSVRVGAYEIIAQQAALRASGTAALSDSATHFRLVLSVPPADSYRVLVEVFGSLDSPGQSGILWTGDTGLGPVGAGGRHEVEVPLASVVPVLNVQVLQDEIALSWNEIAGAERYRVAESLGGGTPRTFTVAGLDTILSFPLVLARGAGSAGSGAAPSPGAFGSPGAAAAAASAGAPGLRQRGAVYRVRAEFADGSVGAYSESVQVSIPDPIPPGSVEDLAVIAQTTTSLSLEWTAPGDDGDQGQALAYDLRVAEVPLSETNFYQVQAVSGLPAPAPAGAGERFVVTGLLEDHFYYLALKTSDDAGAISAISNIAARATLDATAPAAVGDLAAETIDDQRIRLRWTATGDNGLSGHASAYDLRFSLDSLNAENFSAASPVPGTYAPGPAGAAEEVVAEYLQPATRYFFALRVRDEAGNASPLSVVAADTTVGCAVSPAGIDFGEIVVGETAVDSFLVENSGGGTLQVDVQLNDCGSAFSILSGGGAGTLTGGQSRTVIVSFAPQDEGADACQVQVGTFCLPVELSGSGAYEYFCLVSPDTLDFGEIEAGSTADLDFTITNAGAGDLPVVIGATCESFAVVQGAGSYLLAPEASHAVVVRYSPAAAGEHACSVTTDGATGGPCGPVYAFGSAHLPPECALSDTLLDFGTVEVGQSQTLELTITNSGGGTLEGWVSLSDCAHFDLVTGGGEFALAGGASHTAEVDFAPTESGEHTCAVFLGGSCGPVACQGVGYDPNDNWWSGFQTEGLNNVVYDMKPTSSGLLVCGMFTNAGKQTKVAKWNGSQWESAGSSDSPWLLGPNVDAVAEYQGVAVAAGPYDAAEPRWTVAQFVEGRGWVRLNSVLFDGEIRDLEVHTDGKLYVGGAFMNVGSKLEDYMPYLACWDGEQWLYPAAAPGDIVQDLESYNDVLYAAHAGAKVDGVWQMAADRWVVVGGDADVYALGTYDSDLVAGGLFSEIDGVAANNVARLHGTWYPLGNGTNGVVSCFTEYHGHLIAGGTFTGAGSVLAENIARWDGAQWSRLGSGTNQAVLTLAAWGPSLYCGGWFTEAGEKVSLYIGRWID